MTRSHWPATLTACLDEPVEPQCPLSCVFRETCPTHIQVGIHRLFVEGRYRRPQDCLWWEKLAALCERELGIAPPRTAEELLEAMRERRGISQEGEAA